MNTCPLCQQARGVLYGCILCNKSVCVGCINLPGQICKECQANARRSGRWEFHLLNGTLTLTSEDDPDTQVRLTPTEAYDLLDYLYDHRDELAQADRESRSHNKGAE